MISSARVILCGLISSSDEPVNFHVATLTQLGLYSDHEKSKNFDLHYLSSTKDKNNVAYEIDCGNCKALYFSESKWYI